ncbi:hypothetical protein DU148_18955 [Salmonella enterica subsp. enterica]|uniref:Uncharacterized protein n=1 Tax=Salmonella enterica subsp. enterica serovar London TaxID=149390 RepID=A0A5W2YTG6_SALET|nr:hypothetical protein [Salmonella enterica subsp. enterica serovar Bredeney]EAA4401445.1 hypothetical protein [Salmonella enterica subsp. enterica serovar London]EAB2054000.1 hypothetical protein [Salmonella enterica]EAB6361653.1 hypothetical protein [Salmonella enterica subsp. enterica serovar Hadar]EAB7891731.1 hypothetical protein [Salmonella enterica subsp. enterica serovar Newport]EBV4652591.1 hypothetical protein [Salmonella enterica subsp. enterica serovar Chester]EBW5412804.1 hypoth
MFSGTFVFLAFGEPPTSVEGTRDYSTDFFPPRYVKFHVIRIAVFYVAVFWVLIWLIFIRGLTCF